MKKRSLALVLCLIVLLSIGTVPVSAEGTDTVVKAQSFLDGILAFKGADGEEALDGFISSLAENAGVGSSEWYVLSLSQYGSYGFSGYETALASYLENNSVRSASSRLKYALCLAAVGSTNGYISSALEDSVGEQGIMSFVFGLHLLNNGYVCSKYTLSDIKAKLLEMQCEDGGWAVTGTNGDADVTAMTVQALAPCYENDRDVASAVDKALSFLSERQLEDGDYSSYGKANSESTSQVLIALSALGIDPLSDGRFIKNGNTVLEGLEKYRLSDGSFSHVEDGGYNEYATVQAFCASVSYIRMLEGKPSLYLLDNARPDEVETDDTTGADNDADNGADNDSGARHGYKLPACLIMIGLGACACILLWAFKKRNVKNFIAVLCVVAIGVTVVLVTDVQTADGYYNGVGSPKENVVGRVVMSIRCDTVAGRTDDIPKNGIVLDPVELEISEGDTVYTVLVEAARIYKIQFENKGGASYVYIAGINYLYEFDYGDLSGWVYKVNGVRPSVGAGEYVLKDGDVIEWQYTLELGNDLD